MVKILPFRSKNAEILRFIRVNRGGLGKKHLKPLRNQNRLLELGYIFIKTLKLQ